MPHTGTNEAGGKDPAKGSAGTHQPPKVPLLGISKIPRTPSPSSSHGDEHLGAHQSPTGDVGSQNLPFKEGTFQTITPRTLSLLTPRSAAAYNAAAFAAFSGGSQSSFSPFYGTTAMQRSVKSYGNLQHYAAVAQDVDELIKRTELAVDRLRFSSVSFSNAVKLRSMASAVYFTSSAPSIGQETSEKEATFRDTVLAWKFESSGERLEGVTCKSMDMRQCEEETFCAECTYLFAVFVATFYSPKQNSPSPSAEPKRSSSADVVDMACPQLDRVESEGEEDKEALPERNTSTAITPGRKQPSHGHHQHHRHNFRGLDSGESTTTTTAAAAAGAHSGCCEGEAGRSLSEGKSGEACPAKQHDFHSPRMQSERAQSSPFSSSFSEPTVIHLEWEDSERDDAEADREIADTLASPMIEGNNAFRLHTVRPAVPPPEDLGYSLGRRPEDVTLCADRFFDTTLTPRGISSAFATLPRVRDDDVMHVNRAMLHHLGGTASTLLGTHKEIGIGQVCIDLHIWNGDKSSSFTRAAAFSKALRLDRAWALPSAARAASLLVFSHAGIDTAAVTTPRGEHVMSKPGERRGEVMDPEHLGPKEYSMSDLIRSKLLRTYRSLAASFSPGFLQMIAGRGEGQIPGYYKQGSESERTLHVSMTHDRVASPSGTLNLRGISPDDRQARPTGCRHRHKRIRVGRSGIDSGGSSESESDNDDGGRMSEFKVPYNVFRVPSSRERTCSSPGSASADPANQRVEITFHLDQRQTVSDDEFADENLRMHEVKPEFVKPSMPATEGASGPSPLYFRFSPSQSGSSFRPVPPKSISGSSPESGSPLSPSSPVGFVSPISPMKPVTPLSPMNPPPSPTGVDKGKSARSRRHERPKSGDGDRQESEKGNGSKMPKLVVKPESVDSSLKSQGKSLSGSSLNSKKPQIPMLSLKQKHAEPHPSGGTSDRSAPSELTSKRKTSSAFMMRSRGGAVSPVPRLTISRELTPETLARPTVQLQPRSRSGDPSSDSRRESAEGDDPNLDAFDPDDSDQDRNGGEVNGGMRLYRSVLSKIDDQLYLTGEGGAQDLARLREVGVGQIVNVADAVCHEYHPGKFTYLSIDLQDNGAKEDLRPLFLKTIDFIEKHRTVLHCQQGISRSATMVIAYIMWKYNLTFRQALDYVMKRRPVVSPNGGFMGQLLLWEVVLQNSREARKSAPPRLLRIVPHPGSRHELLMVGKDVANVSRASLDQRGCFLLHNPATRTVYMWLGNACLPILASGGASVCEMMKKYLWVEDVFEERQDFESDAFWHTLRDNRGTVGIVDEFSREYAPRVPGFIYRFSAFDPIELTSTTLNSLYEQSRRQVWVYYREDKTITVFVPERFLQRVNGREISDKIEIASITSKLFCIAARLPEETPFEICKDGKALLDEWLGKTPFGRPFKKFSPLMEADKP